MEDTIYPSGGVVNTIIDAMPGVSGDHLILLEQNGLTKNMASKL